MEGCKLISVVYLSGALINPYPAYIFSPENVCLLPLLHILRCTQTNLITEANTMNPDQTAPKEHSDLGPYCLQYRLPKYISRRE